MATRSQPTSASRIHDDLTFLRDHQKSARILAGFLGFAAAVTTGVFLFAFLAGSNLLPALRAPAARWTALLVIIASSAAAFVLYVMRPLLWRPTYESLARMAEENIDGLDNSLINAVQLAKARRSSSPLLLFRAIDECLERAGRFNILAAVDRSALKKRAVFAAVVFAAAAIYFLAAPQSFAAGLSMLLSPSRFVPSVGSARIAQVSPGDAEFLKGRPITIEAALEHPLNDIPAASIIARFPGGKSTKKNLLALSPVRLRCSMGPAELPFDYMVEIAGTQSRWFHVTVADRPSVRSIALGYRYPSYTGLPPKSVENTDGDIRAPYGTDVTVEVVSTKPIASGRLQFDEQSLRLRPLSNPLLAQASFQLTTDGLYRIVIEDQAGRENSPDIPHAVRAIPDEAPSVSIPLPGRDLTAAAGSTLEIAVDVYDDYGVDKAQLVFVDPDTSAERVAHTFADAGAKAATLPYALELDPDIFHLGAVYTYFARATDANTLTGPGTGKSRRYTLRIVDPAAAQAELVATLDSIHEELKRILAAQEAAHTETATLEHSADPDTVASVKNAQHSIRALTTAVADQLQHSPLLADLRRLLEGLIAGDMTSAVDLSRDLAADPKNAAARVKSLLGSQQRIIAILTRLLQAVALMAEQAAAGTLAEGTQIPADVEQKLQELLDRLKDFLQAQKRIVEATSNLAALPVDDYTDDQRKLLNELSAEEADWSKFLKEAWSDLSKLPEQDFSNPSLLEDLVETFSEVEMAADALAREAVILAVPHEQAGVELAEELTTHLEKWLTDFPDRYKWEMEEPLTDIDVPMAELPTELQDIIGDLMEQEEDLFSDLEDISSSWADSLDRGAGWDALDGPISNMSAQGVTGNVLPNSSEISGRSGEGRTGKAHGEFVGDSAVGKGGRRTPTRITPDDFLAGEINDTSAEAATGATGGGKISGAGEEGLQGPVPRSVAEKMAALAGRQAQIISHTQKLSIDMTLAGYPNADMEASLDAMTAVEESLRTGHLGNAIRRRPVLIKSLKNVRSVVARDILIRKDNSLVLPSRLRDEIIDGAQGKAPRGYEALLKGYYESLSVAK